jgi:hypothetical protein
LKLVFLIHNLVHNQYENDFKTWKLS